MVQTGLALLSVLALQTASGAGDPAVESPAPLQTCEAGSLEVQLLGTQSGRSPRDLRSVAVGKERRWTRLDLRLRLAHAPTRWWLPQRIELRNSRGEVWRPAQTAAYFRPNGEGSFGFPDPPARFRGACRLRLELARSTRYLPYEFWEVFGPDELWTVPLLPLPRPNAALPLKTHAASAIRGGVHVRLVQVAGARSTTPATKRRLPVRPSVQVRYSPAAPALNVTLIRATDFKGRSIPLAAPPIPNSAKPSGGERSILFPMRTYRDSRVLNATFAVHRSRYVELTLPAVGVTGARVAARTR
jgi:hypothetical protein